ncbi:MAG TPA: lipid-A-disaccharide synthase [Bacteroidetes bacterium]|nr:lipid-A-disaccharide synthase [Bacteroidota bacterium]
MNKKFYIIAGEASGDMHASNLVKAMYNLDKDIQINGFGGPKMEQSGVKISRDLEKLSLVGFVEILKHINTIRENFSIAKREILEMKPDAVILIDYPGFNLRMAKWAKSQGIKVIYYIAPQVWAWGKKRVKKMKKYIDKLFVILPFEEEFFRKNGIDAEFVGHPLLEEISQFNMEDDFLIKNKVPVNKKLIAFLPGSRTSEIKENIKPVLPVIEKNKDFFFLVAAKTDLSEDTFKVFNNYENVKVIYDQTYKIFNVCDAGIIKSGTSTLEAALFELPQLVIYKVKYISYLIVKNLVDVKFASLVNLILNKEVVTELLQNKFVAKNVDKELNRLFETGIRNNMINEYLKLNEMIRKDKTASELVAERILNFE